MVESDIDIPNLTKDHIEMQASFINVKELYSSSIIEWLLMIEMLMVLNNSFEQLQSSYIRSDEFPKDLVKILDFYLCAEMWLSLREKRSCSKYRILYLYL